MVVIEHHTELLEVCDRLVELGPEGGEAGGQIIASGTPAELAVDKASVTGRWLSSAGGAQGKARPGREAPGEGRVTPKGSPARKGSTKSTAARKPGIKVKAASAPAGQRASATATKKTRGEAR